MLEYKITPLDIVVCTLTDPIILVIIIIIYMTLGYYLFRVKSKVRIVILLILVSLPFLLILPTLFDVISGWKWYGYVLYDHKLHIRAWPVDEVIDLNNSKVFLTKSEEWRPKIRTFGVGMSKIGMGYFILNNGVKGVVFRYGNSNKFVVINASGRYYVIIHPGVEKLYEAIVRIKKSVPSASR